MTPQDNAAFWTVLAFAVAAAVASTQLWQTGVAAALVAIGAAMAMSSPLPRRRLAPAFGVAAILAAVVGLRVLLR